MTREIPQRFAVGGSQLRLIANVPAGLVLLANSAYAQATILWITMTPMLYKFNGYCEVRYGSAVRRMPLETASTAPTASIPAVVYMPPALRKGAAGWYPEFGKVRTVRLGSFWCCVGRLSEAWTGEGGEGAGINEIMKSILGIMLLLCFLSSQSGR